jgi:hypothetical protein
VGVKAGPDRGQKKNPLLLVEEKERKGKKERNSFIV